ncbi:MAG TPA: hypothetical protein VJ553_00605 [Candidatus Paceibacterota bacterium]|nr:hypothetical protein [Candidatus Paceibacterota bacterium]
MSTLLYAFQQTELPSDENIVRQTTHAVRDDEPAAEQDSPPEFNELRVDESPYKGLTRRTLASDWTQGEKTPPPTPELALPRLPVTQQSQQGTAAAREASGERGPGTLSYAYGIEPTIRDGGAFGDQYIAFDPDRTIQETAGQYMTPSGTDSPAVARVMRTGKSAAQDAAVAGMYRDFFSSVQSSGAGV